MQEETINAQHAKRGYDSSVYGKNVAYHFFIGKDGTLKQERSLNERTQHTACGLGLEKCLNGKTDVNNASIGIVLADNFQVEEPSPQQLKTLRELVTKLDSMYHFEEIGGHRRYSPTACPGQKLLDAIPELLRVPKTKAAAPAASVVTGSGNVWGISRYYSPVEGQPEYYNGRTYLADVKMNCGLNADGTAGDCSTTADGYKLQPEDAYKVVACPREMPFGTRLKIEGLGVVTCRDRGSAIQNKRLDLWTGYGETGLNNIRLSTKGTGQRRVEVLADQ